MTTVQGIPSVSLFVEGKSTKGFRTFVAMYFLLRRGKEFLGRVSVLPITIPDDHEYVEFLYPQSSSGRKGRVAQRASFIVTAAYKYFTICELSGAI